MIVPDMVAAMKAAGCSPEQIVAAMEYLGDVSKQQRSERNRRYYQTRKTREASEIKTPNPSEIKTPKTAETSETSRARVEDSSKPSEYSGKKDNSASKGHRLPEGWTPSAALTEFALNLGLGGPALDEAVAEFRDYWRGVPGQRGRKLDWDATFRNRLRDLRSPHKKGQSNNGKGSIVDAGKRLVERLEREYGVRADPGPAGGPIGDPAVWLLPGQRSQRP